MKYKEKDIEIWMTIRNFHITKDFVGNTTMITKKNNSKNSDISHFSDKIC